MEPRPRPSFLTFSRALAASAAALSALICLGFAVSQTKQPAPQPAVPAASLTAPAALPLHLSVQTFGALGNGKADDTSAIQAAIDAAAQQGKAVYFPKGTYRIRIQPQLSRALTLYKNTVLWGAGAENSILKLSDHSGNYSAILSGAALSSDLSNLTLRDLTLDGNAPLNPVFSEQDFKPDQDRFGLRVYVGRKIRIERCRFTNLDNINVLTLNNDQLVSDITIQNNRFDAIGGGTFDHDHSTIYVHGKRSLIVGNTFHTRNGSGTQGARTAIEIHGDQHQVLNNRIFGFTYGINVTGIASSSNDQLIQGNVIQGVHTGILLWSFLDQGQSSGLENIVIDRNQIRLNVLAWRRLWGGSPNQGIALEPNSDGPIQTLQITANDIAFQNIGDEGRRSDALAAGIVLWRSKPSAASFQNVVLARNHITAPLAAGLYVAVPIRMLDIAQNTILNPGQGKYPYHPHYRSGMILGGGPYRMQVRENQIIDNQTPSTLSVGMLLQGKCDLCLQTQNQIHVAQNAKIPLLLQTP